MSLRPLLVLDPDSVRRAALQLAMPPGRFELIYADTADQALATVGRQRVDAALVCGVANGQALRSAWPRLPILLMDPRYADPEIARQECRAAGADSAIPLPCDRDTFETRLEEARAIADSRSGAAPMPSAAPARPSAQGWDVFRRRVDDLYRDLDRLDYYQLLQLDPGATPAAIKTAYYARAMELHPDRFLNLEDAELKDKVYQVFKRISESFKVLSDAATRAEYDGHLRGPERDRHLRFVRTERPRSGPRDPAEIARTPAGRKYVSHALVAERQGNLSSAKMYLSLAIQAEPDNDAVRRKLEEVTSGRGSKP